MLHAAIVIALAAGTQRQSASTTAPTGGASRPASGPACIVFTLEPLTDIEHAVTEYSEDKLAAQAAQLIAAASGDNPNEASARKAAHFIISRACEPALSRVLLGIADPADGETLSKAAGQVRALLNHRPATSSAPSTAEAQGSAIDPKLLAALAEVYAALAANFAPNPADQAETRGRLVKAAQGLAQFVDDELPAIAGVARLLQSACYRRAGKAERAIELLSSPSATSFPVQLQVFGWLEYCRAIADEQGFTAAIALTIRDEARIGGTVPVAHRTPANYSFRALRVTLLGAWSAKLRESGAIPDADRAAAHAARLTKSFNANGPVPLSRLGSVLPDIESDNK